MRTARKKGRLDRKLRGRSSLSNVVVSRLYPCRSQGPDANRPIPAVSGAPVSNHILAALPGGVREILAPALERVALEPDRVLLVPDAPVEHVHFLEGGVASLSTDDGSGAEVEVASVGRDGLIGIPLVFGSGISPHAVTMLVGGEALRMEAKAFREACETLPALREQSHRFARDFLAQVIQTGACNARHTLEKRIARWLLLTSGRAGSDELRITHERLSQALGVRRAGVTLALHTLEATGAIRSTRGRLVIRDRSRLQAGACDCCSVAEPERRLPARDGLRSGMGGAVLR